MSNSIQVDKSRFFWVLRCFKGFFVFILFLNIFPSWIALSKSYSESFPKAFEVTGPLNPLKLGFPLLAVLLGLQWRELDRGLRRVFGWFLFALGLFTLWGGIRCENPFLGFREGMVLFVGVGSALVLTTLSKRALTLLTLGWGGVVFFAGITEFLFPALVNWCFKNLFDPLMVTEFSWGMKGTQGVMVGFWDRGTFGKLCALVPWISCAYLWPFLRCRPQARTLLGVILILVFPLFILGTTQRAALLGYTLGALALGVHSGWLCRGSWSQITKRYALVLTGIGLILGTAFTFLPREKLMSRLGSLVFYKGEGSEDELLANQSRDVRYKIWKFSEGVVSDHPLGNLCIADEEFKSAGLDLPYHAHNMFLQQFRAKGWVFGGIHLVLWGLAAFGFLRLKPGSDSFFVAGMIATLVVGSFDHPWWVLNQAVILAFYLVFGLRCFLRQINFGK